MRTARPTRRQLEAAADVLDFDALAVSPVEMPMDLLAEFDYEVYDAPEFDLVALPLEEFEAAIIPAGVEAGAWAPVVELLSTKVVVGGQTVRGKSTGDLAALFGFGEVA